MTNARQRQYLGAMGIEVWRERQAKKNPPIIPIAQMNWEELQAEVSTCIRCDLSKSRSQTVFGSGDHQAKLMIIGEAPGMHEDLQGQPFVGRAGVLLNAILKAIGLTRDQVFIANVLKCRPPQNRDPNITEVKCCTPFLQRQIELLQPKLIVALGRIAAHFLLNQEISLAKLRGIEHTYHHTPLIVTYHPAYLLRSPAEKKKAWRDWQGIQRHLRKIDAESI